MAETNNIEKTVQDMIDKKINSLRDEKNTELTRLRREMNTWHIFFLVVMVLVVVFSVWYIGNVAEEIGRVANAVNQTGKVELTIKRNNLLSADYLAIAIPVMVALAGALVTFLGMNRLSMFDERIDKIQKDLKDDLTAHAGMIQDTVGANLKSEINDKEVSIQEKIDGAVSQIQSAATKSNDEIKKDGFFF